jgi:hypothetical protein
MGFESKGAVSLNLLSQGKRECFGQPRFFGLIRNPGHLDGVILQSLVRLHAQPVTRTASVDD